MVPTSWTVVTWELVKGKDSHSGPCHLEAGPSLSLPSQGPGLRGSHQLFPSLSHLPKVRRTSGGGACLQPMKSLRLLCARPVAGAGISSRQTLKVS